MQALVSVSLSRAPFATTEVEEHLTFSESAHMPPHGGKSQEVGPLRMACSLFPLTFYTHGNIFNPPPHKKS